MFSDQSIDETSESSDTETKIRKIIDAEFSREIENKKKEIFDIYKNLNKATKYLHYLRYSIVNNYYTRPELYADDVVALSKQSRIHPALVYTTGEESLFPKPDTDINLSDSSEVSHLNLKRKNGNNDEHKNKKAKYSGSSENTFSKGAVTKVKKRIAIKNLSKRIPEEDREKNNCTHKWSIIILDEETKKVPEFISKVRYFLHESYKPHDVVEVTSVPFSLNRYGWGEFPVRVQLHFVSTFDRPVDIIHNLKLTTKYTGFQILSDEHTIFDVWIHTNDINFLPIREEQNNLNNILSHYGDNLINDYKKIHINNENITINSSEYDLKELFSPKIYSLFNDHDYTGRYLKFENENTSDYDELESELNFSTSENPCQLNPCDDILNGFTNGPHKNNFKKASNGHTFELSNQLYNFENTDIFDKRIYRYNCAIIQKEYVKILVSIVKQVKLKTPFDMFKFIIRRMPLITKKAADCCYKMLHPYACESFQVFNNYSVGKQRSIEWYRAKQAIKILKSAGCNVNEYSIKEFIICARKYCYTPIMNQKCFGKNYALTQKENSNLNFKTDAKSSTNLKSVDEWINYIEDNKIYKDLIDEEEIDIINIPVEMSNLKEKKLENQENSSGVMDFLKIEDDLNEFVFSTLEKYGFKLENEEIIPGVLHCAGNVLIVKAVKCLIEDLLRTSFSCVVDESQSVDFKFELKRIDVCKALLKRDEFKFFTNKYLGSHR